MVPLWVWSSTAPKCTWLNYRKSKAYRQQLTFNSSVSILKCVSGYCCWDVLERNKVHVDFQYRDPSISQKVFLPGNSCSLGHDKINLGKLRPMKHLFYAAQVFFLPSFLGKILCMRWFHWVFTSNSIKAIKSDSVEEHAFPSYHPLAKLVMGLPKVTGVGCFQLNFRFVRLHQKGMFIYLLTNMLGSSTQGYPANLPCLCFRWIWLHSYHFCLPSLCYISLHNSNS